jgi:predicted nucleic acid-binding protein
MPFVLDASIVHSWAFNEGQPAAAKTRERMRSDSAVVPSIWWYEVRNGLIMAERRRRSTENATDSFLRGLARLRVSIHDLPDESALIAVARRHRLTFYDAAYLELALREGIDLATLDTELANAARAERVSLIA